MPNTILKRVANALGVRDGFVDEVRRQATPLVVDCIGLTRDYLGDEQFEREFHGRKEWLHENCKGVYEIEPIRHDGKLVGRRFRFDDVVEAIYFKLRFDINL